MLLLSAGGYACQWGVCDKDCMPQRSQTQNLPPLRTRAAVEPTTLDRANRTVEVTWTAGARVLRGFWDRFWEELSLDPKHVRLDRLNNGAPFLADHDAYKVVETPGVVERAWLTKAADGSQVGRALVRFVKAGVDPEADRLFEKIADGIVVNVSVGYRVHKFEKVSEEEDGIPVMRAVSWTPHEISSVAIGADDGAGFRSAQDLTPNPCEVIERNDMETQEKIESTKVRAERERAATIADLTRQHDLSDLGKRLIEEGIPLDAARARILDALAKRSEEMDINPHVRTDGLEAGQRGTHDDFRAAAIDAIVMRSGIKVDKPHPAAVDLRHAQTLEIARMALSRSGKRHGPLSGSELIKRAMTTSDFPEILSGSIGKSVRQGYETEPASHRQFVSVETVPDFRENLRPILGSAPALEKIGEMGEYKYGSMTEDAASYRVYKYGRAIALSWELLVNDSLGAFLRVQPALGQAARRGEADAVYALFAENSGAGPTMSDGNPLFHASHKNVGGADSGVSVDGLGAARTLLRKQTAVGGGFLSLVPRYLLLPAELETQADLVLASASRAVTSGVEADMPQWISRLVPVVEPRLPASAYYLIASSEQVDTVVLGLLDENEGGPVIEEDREFNRDAHRTKVRHVYGAKVLDYRGMVKVPST